MDYAKVIRERRPKLRDNSVNAYALSLKSIAPPDNKDMDYLYDTEAILQRLEKYKPNTRKNHLNAAVVVLQGIDTEKAKKVTMAWVRCAGRKVPLRGNLPRTSCCACPRMIKTDR